MHKFNLFCVPYAGAGADVFYKWNDSLDQELKLFPVELAGRGKKACEPLYSTMDEAVNDVYDSIHDLLDEKPYALFGHSMGSIILYELYYKIVMRGKPRPIHMFFSGRFPPHLKLPKSCYHQLSDNELKEKILELGGVPEELFKYNILLKQLFPRLRSDFKIVETYTHCSRQEKIECDVSILYSKSDKGSEQIRKWEELVNGKCYFMEFDDGHFFINTFQDKVLECINKTVKISSQDCIDV